MRLSRRLRSLSGNNHLGELIRQGSVLPLSLDHGLKALAVRLGHDNLHAVVVFQVL